MITKKYYLYLDEMLENIPEGVNYFSLAGYIIEENERDILDAKIKQLKIAHNITGIIHWTEIRGKKGIWKDKKYPEIEKFLEDFIEILENASLTVVASMYDVKLINENIKSNKWLSHRHIYCMKKIFENFFIFLNKENATSDNVEGHIIIESSSIDEELKKLFHSVMIFGTDFVSQKGLTKFIKDIDFIPKIENNNLLQVADLMPSEIHRYLKENDKFSSKMTPLKEKIQKIRLILMEKGFDGYTNRKDLFGIHILE